MKVASRENISRILDETNTHWRTGKLEENKQISYKRNTYLSVLKSIVEKGSKLTILYGARGTGKTTIAHQIISGLIRNKVSSKGVVYIPFDNPVLSQVSIKDLLAIYRLYISGEKQIVCILDEAWKAQDFESDIDEIIRKGDTKILFISSMIFDFKKMFKDIPFQCERLWQLGFFEFCEMRGKRTAIKKRLSINELYDKTQIELNNYFLRLSEIEKEFNKYIFSGTFPKTWTNILQSEADMSNAGELRKINAVNNLLCMLVQDSGKPFNLSRLLQGLGETYKITRPTAENLIALFEQSGLISKVSQFDCNLKRVEKAFSVIYPNSLDIFSSIFQIFPNTATPLEIEALIKTAIFDNTYASLNPTEVGYMQVGTKKIDIVLKLPEPEIIHAAIIPEGFGQESLLIDVAYNNDGYTLSSLLVEKASPAQRGIIITKNPTEYGLLEQNKNILKIPAYAFLYSL
jgi:predicted AAA+ superfamily ATPase